MPQCGELLLQSLLIPPGQEDILAERAVIPDGGDNGRAPPGPTPSKGQKKQKDAKHSRPKDSQEPARVIPPNLFAVYSCFLHRFHRDIILQGAGTAQLPLRTGPTSPSALRDVIRKNPFAHIRQLRDRIGRAVLPLGSEDAGPAAAEDVHPRLFGQALGAIIGAADGDGFPGYAHNHLIALIRWELDARTAQYRVQLRLSQRGFLPG